MHVFIKYDSWRGTDECDKQCEQDVLQKIEGKRAEGYLERSARRGQILKVIQIQRSIQVTTARLDG